MKDFLVALWRCIDWIIAGLLLAMILLVFTNVVLRYGFASGLRASVELSRLAFVWIVMIGSVSILRRGGHLGMPEFAEAYMRPFLPVLKRINWAVVLGCSVMIAWGCWRATLSNWHNISPITGLPNGLFFLSGLVSGMMMAGISIFRLVNPDSEEPAQHGGDIA
ncbi:MAG: TRAP transporter small permease [Paracoccus sp. (in: a-proteobacteria)]|uniref:TRAP transporter small permease n=1 Tax=Paracoccus sp. TaxID=267 RepID=UPI0039E24195